MSAIRNVWPCRPPGWRRIPERACWPHGYILAATGRRRAALPISWTGRTACWTMRPSAATVSAIRPSVIPRSCSGASCPGCTAAMPTAFSPRTGNCGCAGCTPVCAWPSCRRNCWSGTIAAPGHPQRQPLLRGRQQPAARPLAGPLAGAPQPLASAGLSAGRGQGGTPPSGTLWEKGVQVARFRGHRSQKIGQRVRGVPVIGQDGLPRPGRCFLLNAPHRPRRRRGCRPLAGRRRVRPGAVAAGLRHPGSAPGRAPLSKN